VNYLPVMAEQEGTRSASMLVDCPGLREVVTVGTGPHRWGGNVGGKRLVVSGNKLYQVNPDSSLVTLGTIPGTGRVSATFNQANQVAFATGSAGYVLELLTMTVSQITDSAFPGAILFDYIGQLGVSLDPNRQFFRNSAINDLSAYSALEKYQGEASPDLLVAIKVCHSELLAFSETTTEVFDNTSDPSSIADHILFLNKKITIQRGCASSYAVSLLDNSALFPGDDGNGYRLNGYTPERITNFPIEQDWARCDLSKAFAMTWEDRGHKVWYITCPDGHTWGYDVASRKWHRRQSYGLNRWRLNTLFEWNGDWYGGDFQSGMLYRLDWDYMLEGPNPLIRERTLGVLHANQNPVICESVELVVNTGGPVSVYIPGALIIEAPLCNLRISTEPTHQYVATNATGAVTFSIVSGTMPLGLSMDSSGLISGGVTRAVANYTYRVKAVDAQGTVGYLDETVGVIPYHMMYQLSESGSTAARRLRIGLATFDNYNNVFTVLATADLTPAYPARGNSGFRMETDKYVIHAEYDNDSATNLQKSGVYVASYSAGTLTLSAPWQGSSTQYHQYYDVAKYNASTVVCVLANADNSFKTELHALAYSAGALSATGTPIVVSNGQHDTVLCMHNAYLLVLSYDAAGASQRFLKAYSFTSGTFTLLATCATSLTGSWSSNQDELVSDGSFIYLPNGMIFSFNGSAFTLITTAAGVAGFGGRLAVWPGYLAILDGTTNIRVWSFNGTTATSVQTLAGTWAAEGRACALPLSNIDGVNYGYYLLPAPDITTDSQDGMFFWDGNAQTLTREAKLEIPNDNRATGEMVTINLVDDELS